MGKIGRVLIVAAMLATVAGCGALSNSRVSVNSRSPHMGPVPQPGTDIGVPR
ncbi:hypothetical protein FHS53_001660 [Xanthobacter tagetidis]|jgi:hypothetical protein|nr:hypothetical protein [Xanthobacter tagetidis]